MKRKYAEIMSGQREDRTMDLPQRAKFGAATRDMAAMLEKLMDDEAEQENADMQVLDI